MAKVASLRICKAEVELLTEREHLDLIEPAVRGGVASVYEERRFVVNKCYLKTMTHPRNHFLVFVWMRTTSTEVLCS